MAFQQQSSFWFRLSPVKAPEVAPEEALTEPMAPQRSETPDPYAAYTSEDELETVMHAPKPMPTASTLRERRSRDEAESTAVRCAIPVTLRMLTGNPRALLTLLDLDRVVVQAEQALPDQATVWIRLPFATGSEVVRGRVTCSDRRTPSSPWEALIRLEVSSSSTRNGLVGLVRSLKERARR